MDAEHLDLPDASFDAVLYMLGLMYLPHPERAVAEMRRVLRPRGRIVPAGNPLVRGARDRNRAVQIQQLCRWLLRSLDRLSSNQLTVAQELIANMLGVRREGVTEAAGKLHKLGVVRYARGSRRGAAQEDDCGSELHLLSTQTHRRPARRCGPLDS